MFELLQVYLFPIICLAVASYIVHDVCGFD